MMASVDDICSHRTPVKVWASLVAVRQEVGKLEKSGRKISRDWWTQESREL